MAKLDGTKWETVIDRIQARITDQLDDATDDNCIISDDPEDLPSEPGGDFFYVVSPPPAHTFTVQFEGGETTQADVRTTVIITAHSIAQQDEPGRAVRWFTDGTYGIFIVTTTLLKALLGHVLLDSDGDEIMNEPIHPSNISWKKNSRARGSVQIALDINFDWDLT